MTTKAITGREFVAAAKKAATWHTPVACGSGNGLLLLSDGLKATIGLEVDESAGQTWPKEADAGPQTVTGTIESYMRYEGLDVLLALVCGIAGAPTLAGTLSYANAYKLDTDIDGLFATIAMLKQSEKVWEIPSAKIHGFKLTFEAGKPGKIVFDLIGDTLQRSSATNTYTTMGSVTVPDSGNRVIMGSGAVFWLNDSSGDALDSGDAIAPSKFEMTFKRPMSSEQVAGTAGTTEPADNGFPECSISMTFPRYDATNDAFFTDWEATTSKKMTVTFTGGLIETAHYYTFKVSFPNIKIENPEAPVSGPGKIPMNLKGRCLGRTAAPTGMTGITQPFQFDVVNKRSTDPLA